MSLDSWFVELENEAKTAVTALGDEIGKIATAIGPVVIEDLEAFLKELGSLAIQAVLAEAPKVISGQEKFGNAVASVVQSVEAQGKAVAVSDAQMAVQGAYHAVQIALTVP